MHSHSCSCLQDAKLFLLAISDSISVLFWEYMRYPRGKSKKKEWVNAISDECRRHLIYTASKDQSVNPDS